MFSKVKAAHSLGKKAKELRTMRIFEITEAELEPYMPESQGTERVAHASCYVKMDTGRTRKRHFTWVVHHILPLLVLNFTLSAGLGLHRHYEWCHHHSEFLCTASYCIQEVLSPCSYPLPLALTLLQLPCPH